MKKLYLSCCLLAAALCCCELSGCGHKASEPAAVTAPQPCCADRAKCGCDSCCQAVDGGKCRCAK